MSDNIKHLCMICTSDGRGLIANKQRLVPNSHFLTETQSQQPLCYSFCEIRSKTKPPICTLALIFRESVTPHLQSLTVSGVVWLSFPKRQTPKVNCKCVHTPIQSERRVGPLNLSRYQMVRSWMVS